jgi:flotillin
MTAAAGDIVFAAAALAGPAAGGSGPPILFVAITAGVSFVAILVMVILVFRSLHVCGSDEVLVVSGRPRRLPDGSVVNYRIVRPGGRVVVVPILESLARLDLGLVMVDIAPEGACSRGNVPLAVRGLARVRISPAPDRLPRAIERFLGRGREEVAAVARETLEGSLRAVAAQHSAEELQGDLAALALQLRRRADEDFAKLGLEIGDIAIREVGAAPPVMRVPE